jgi:hypothetical protein
MTPSRLLDELSDPGHASAEGVSQLRQQRRGAYEGRITSSHWPHVLKFGMSGVGEAGQGPLDYEAASTLRKSLIG